MNIKRLQDLLSASILNKVQIAEQCKISRTTLDSILSGSDARISTVESLASVLGVSVGYLFEEEAQESKIEVKKIHTPKCYEPIHEEISTTLYDIDAAANLNTLMADKNSNIIGRITIPNAPVCDGAIYVKGDSMYPLLKSGDIVGYKEIPLDMRYIHFGEMYIVSIDEAGDEYLTVKYIQLSEKGEDWVKLVSYNTHHSPKDYHVSSLKGVALVKFSVRMNTMR